MISDFEAGTLKTIETGRLILRAMAVDDLEDFYQSSRKPNIGPNAGWKPHESREETLQVMGMFLGGEADVWVIVEKESGRFVGTIGLNGDNKRNLRFDEVRNLGYALDDTAWGKGYATEAAMAVVRYGFEELHLLMITAQHYPNNVASGRVIEKCGFYCEGTFRMATRLFNDNIMDNVCYSLTRMEYEETYGAKER